MKQAKVEDQLGYELHELLSPPCTKHVLSFLSLSPLVVRNRVDGELLQ
jgi:hypothetical protein